MNVYLLWPKKLMSVNLIIIKYTLENSEHFKLQILPQFVVLTSTEVPTICFEERNCNEATNKMIWIVS